MLSLGSSDFGAIRERGAVYVDKTDYVFELSRPYTSYFLSRPRRFGKSLLVSTFENYFRGRRGLFEGLKIFPLEEATASPWEVYPVFKFSFAGGYSCQGLREVEMAIAETLEEIEEEYGLEPGAAKASLPIRLSKDIGLAWRKTGRRVVVLVDEYDNPLEKAQTAEENDKIRSMFKSLWGVLKDRQDKLRFVFFTGVTKYQKVSIFSELNNLIELSMDGRYAAICGLVRREIEDNYGLHVDALARRNGMSRGECLAEMERRYDGYHFAWPSAGVYNPYSVLNALDKGEFGNYWFRSGMPGLLPKRIVEEGFDLSALIGGRVAENADRLSDLTPGNMALVPLLFQTGYLTLKGPMDDFRYFPLGFPNEEVRVAFTEQLVPLVLPAVGAGARGLTFRDIADDLNRGDVASCLDRLTAIFASLPYERGNAKGDPVEVNFQNVIYVVFTMLGIAMRTEVAGAGGVCDAVVETAAHAYVFEFKRDKPAGEALAQIRAKGYADRFAATTKRLHLVGVSFSTSRRQIGEWREEMVAAPR